MNEVVDTEKTSYPINVPDTNEHQQSITNDIPETEPMPEGAIIIDNYQHFHINEYYDYSSYDGKYSYLIDTLYRIKLDINNIEINGRLSRFYRKYKSSIEDFLDGKTVTCVLPCIDNGDSNSITTSWTRQFYELVEMDSERVYADEKLMDLFRMDCQRWALSYYDLAEEIQNEYPELYRLIYPELPSITGVSYDSKTMRTVISVDTHGEKNFIYILQKGPISKFAKNYNKLESDDEFTVPVTYEGYVSIACIDENGLIGETASVYIEPQTDWLSSITCEFSCVTFRKALYSYLEIPDSVDITPAMLLNITSIYINGSDIYFNEEGLDVDKMNENDGSKLKDICFEDFDYFVSLENLTIEHNSLPALSGSAIKYVTTLELTDCGVKDISYLEGSFIQYLRLYSNAITDATVLANMPYLKDAYLANNPVGVIELPETELSNISIRNSKITTLDWLEDVAGLFSFDCSGTKISDLSILGDFSDLHLLYLPEGADYSFVVKLDKLHTLWVGSKQINVTEYKEMMSKK